jgi:dsRNA-specific ribonuclease
VNQEISKPEKLVQEAWIGDAVLCLYAREMVLREEGRLDNEKSVRLTCNQFLGCLGEPTRMEAQVGRVYQRDGLAAAFAWIEEHLLPLFRRHEANRIRKNP